MAVAVDQNGGLKLFKRLRRCRLPSYSQLDHGRSKPFHRSASTPCLPFDQDDLSPRIEIVGGCRAASVRSLVAEVSIAIGSGVGPLPVSSGLGGAYLLKGQNGENIAVTKPVDEEPFALNNPKGFAGRMLGQPGIKSSVRIGETGVRELAAYLLDHGGFAGVPPSALVKISHVSFHLIQGRSNHAIPFKIASLQRFVDHEFDAGELGPLGFSVGSVHRIGILDVRLLNLDRHAGNILVKKRSVASGPAELVPIDHGLCLPEWLDDPYFEWLHWPQSSLPFSDSELAYISSLDPFKDAELLRIEIPSLREPCVRVLVLCTIFLKRAVTSGLCLAAIGKMMSREFAGAGEEKPSALESLCAQAKASASGATLFRLGSEDEDNEDSLLDLPRDCPRTITRLSSSFSAGFISGMSTEKEEESLNCGDLRHKAPLESLNIDDLCHKAPLESLNIDDLCHKAPTPLPPGMVRSKSFLAHNGNKEASAVSFGDMSEEHWRLFLESFEGLLPEVLERAKFASQKHRLGSSCKF